MAAEYFTTQENIIGLENTKKERPGGSGTFTIGNVIVAKPAESPAIHLKTFSTGNLKG